MKSREALKHITEDDFNMIITTYHSKPAYNGLTKEDMIFIIERDLEILELLKKLPFEIYQNGGGDNWNWFVDTKQSFKISEEEAIKLKEWLRNE